MDKNSSVKPFLRWAGGKKWLTSRLLEYTENINFTTYIEPFLGGGSVFLSLNPKAALLSDCNEDLINAYQCIKNHAQIVYDYLCTYENTSAFYYKIRSSIPKSEIERAARFIYLNQTSFNGLYRVNQKGEYNVPYGKRKRAVFDLNNFLAVSSRLQNAELIACDFEEAIDKVKRHSLVYLDPPYIVAKDDTGFIGYNQHLFSIDDQKRLSACIDRIKENNAYYILSNAKHPAILEIFNKGDTVIEVERASLIGGKKAYRGKTEEYLFTNIPGVKGIIK